MNKVDATKMVGWIAAFFPAWAPTESSVDVWATEITERCREVPVAKAAEAVRDLCRSTRGQYPPELNAFVAAIRARAEKVEVLEDKSMYTAEKLAANREKLRELMTGLKDAVRRIPGG